MRIQSVLTDLNGGSLDDRSTVSDGRLREIRSERFFKKFTNFYFIHKPLLYFITTDHWPSVTRKWLGLCSCPPVIKSARATQKCKKKSTCYGPMPSCLTRESSYSLVSPTHCFQKVPKENNFKLKNKYQIPSEYRRQTASDQYFSFEWLHKSRIR